MKLRRLRAPVQLILISIGIALGSGCRHKPSPVAVVPPPPPLTPTTPPSTPESSPPPVPAPSAPPASSALASPGSVADNQADADFVSSHPVIYSEEGLASWYGPPYDKRRGANGEIFDKDALTAAHRTLPMNSLIRVTNLASGQSVILRVTDRGPFVANRMLDLSLASAKAIGVWRPGVARVRVEVFAAPSPLDRGGRWCVQIGAFKSEKGAYKLRDQLTRKYSTANVIEFTGPTGHWVRIRPLGDDKGRAVEIAHGLQPSEGEAYLVRLD
ncbi:MAG TPA: septal ring lytic transglycosylase RlpA family protein [Acidobacteriaceae bacterium]|jgi:rare lipoprotein A|nr:septal ring lytic transglycosylase RlpA family protein [Acidobacteriaceae bacterium]